MFKLNYHRRIQLSFLVFIFLPMLAVSVISFILIRGSLVEKLQLSNENFLNVIVDELERTIDDVTFASRFIVNDSSITANLEKIADVTSFDSYEDYLNIKQVESDLSLITKNPLNYHIKMYLVNEHGFTVSSSTEELTNFKHDLTLLKEKVNFEQLEVIQWLGMFKDNPNKKGHYYIARVIGNKNKPGYLSLFLISISESYFEGLLKPINFGRVELIDRDGFQMASNDVSPIEDSKKKNTDLRTEFVLNKTDWTIVYEATQESVMGQISRTFYFGSMGVLLFLIIFSISSMITAKRLYLPIQKLQRVVRQFGMGNLDVRLEVKGNDDIAELGMTLNTMLDQLKQLISDIEQEQEQKRVMELEALFMQIRPHFLLNTLNSIKCSLILEKDKLHSGVIDSLMGLLRAYLKVYEPSTLQEECKLIGNYIDIMKVRNDMSIELEIDLEAGTEQFIIPKLILQPIVENAIIHGAMDHSNAKISVRARKSDNQMTIEIADNGIGMEKMQLQALNNQLNSSNAEEHASYKRVGLINVIQRLRLTYGPSATLLFSQNIAGGITVSVQIPVNKLDNY